MISNTGVIKLVGALGALLLLTACIPPWERPKPVVQAARFCVVMEEPIRPSRKDVLTDGTFEQIASLNGKWDSICPNEKQEPGVK
jgi:hypothetical protein